MTTPLCRTPIIGVIDCVKATKLKKTANGDDADCVGCGNKCAGRGFSNRFEGIQGVFIRRKCRNNPQVMKVVFMCDPCAETYNEQICDNNLLICSCGSEFSIDSSFRMND